MPKVDFELTAENPLLSTQGLIRDAKGHFAPGARLDLTAGNKEQSRVLPPGPYRYDFYVLGGEVEAKVEARNASGEKKSRSGTADGVRRVLRFTA